jgi:hypothetical protein
MKKNLLIFAFSLISFLQANGQEDANLKGFAMTMNLDGNKVEMQCSSGCQWTKLSFTLPLMGKVQMVNENGMAGEETETSKSAFLFDLSFDDNTILLNGHIGTAWKKLSFSMMEGKQAIFDQHGFEGYK